MKFPHALSWHEVKSELNWAYQLNKADLQQQYCLYLSRATKPNTFVMLICLVLMAIVLPSCVLHLISLKNRDGEVNSGQWMLATLILIAFSMSLLCAVRLLTQYRSLQLGVTLGLGPNHSVHPVSTKDIPTFVTLNQEKDRLNGITSTQSDEGPLGMDVLASSSVQSLQASIAMTCTTFLLMFCLYFGCMLIFIQTISPHYFTMQYYQEGNISQGDVNQQALSWLRDGLPLLLIPVLFAHYFVEVSLWIWWSMVICSSGLMLYATILSSLYSSIPSILVLNIIAGFIVTEAHVKNVSFFLSCNTFDEILALKERMTEEKAAIETRHMIANVAHDLKTPLSSFMTGMDFIDHTISDFEFRRNQDMDYFLTTVKYCLSNIRNTNNFMLMTINRCIDYTKASKGLKLTPKWDSIELSETLQLPLQCMQNIQNKLEIDLLPIPNEICTHIITDKQWLQENILCLLSNSVKYSDSGKITIRVFLELMPKKDDSKKKTLTRQDSFMSTASDKTMASEGLKRFSFSSPAHGHAAWRQSSIADMLLGPPVTSPSVSTKNKKVVASGDVADPMLSSKQPTSPGASSPSRKMATIEAIYKQTSGLPKPFPNIDSTSLSPRTDIEQAHHHSSSADDDEEIEKELFLRFEIEDTGIGMSEEAMQALFSPFKQNQRLAGGTGLGLFSLAKRIDAVQGYYGVQNRRDNEQGSLFWFAFPYKPDEGLANLHAQQAFGGLSHGLVGRGSFVRSTAMSVQRQLMTTLHNIQLPLTSSTSNTSLSNLAANGNTVESQNGLMQLIPITPSSNRSGKVATNNAAKAMHLPKTKSLDILVVDDSPAIVKMTRMMLTRMGHNMSVADNGASAVKMVRDRWVSQQSSYDVILMDLQMPIMDGIEATKRIRKLQSSPEAFASPNRNAVDVELFSVLPHQFIVAMSANSDDDTKADVLEAGMDTFLCKPFNMDAFHNMCKEHQKL